MYMYLLWARDSPAFIKLTIAFLETLEIDKRYYKYREKHDKNPKKSYHNIVYEQSVVLG